MENRVRKLKEEERKIKMKVDCTKKNTQKIIDARERNAQKAEWEAEYKFKLEKSIQEKKEKVAKMKLASEQKKKTVVCNITLIKQANVAQVKEQKKQNAEIREEMQRE